MLKLRCFLFIIIVVWKVSAVPPSACRAEFRWDDCGKPAKPVMYYWKQGSRCEIGYWKGCLPNPNMFADEYECINTCVFVDRPLRTETDAPDTVTVTDFENISSIVTNTTDSHDNDNGTTEFTNGSNVSTEKNENTTSSLPLNTTSSDDNTHGNETTNETMNITSTPEGSEDHTPTKEESNASISTQEPPEDNVTTPHV